MSLPDTSPRSLETVLPLDLDVVVPLVTEALAAEGFGVLTDIDLQGTLKKKLGVEVPRYRILGACNPPFAYEAISSDPEAGLMLPCNVVLYELEAGRTRVLVVDPTQVIEARGKAELLPMATKVRARLEAVVARLG